MGVPRPLLMKGATGSIGGSLQNSTSWCLLPGPFFHISLVPALLLLLMVEGPRNRRAARQAQARSEGFGPAQHPISPSGPMSCSQEAAEAGEARLAKCHSCTHGLFTQEQKSSMFMYTVVYKYLITFFLILPFHPEAQRQT